MFDAIRNEFAPKHRKRFDRSVIATAGLLFGFTVCGAVGLLTGRGAFTLDLPMLTLYGSFVPLSIAGFMQHFLDDPPKLPMLATLWFLALFVPVLFFGEVFFGTGTVSLGGISVFLPKLVGFRLMVAAALSGILFGAIRADGSVSEELKQKKAVSVDWETRHRQAVERLARADVALRRSRSHEERALADFDRRLQQVLEDDALASVAEEEEEEVVLHHVESTSAIPHAA